MRRLAIAIVLLAALALPAPAGAHPLGNFTVNQFSLVEASGDRVYVTYVLDLAEIPTFQARGERERAGTDRYARELAETIRAGLSLSVAGEPLALQEREHRLELLPGAGGLQTTRLELVLEAGPVPAAGGELVYRDGSFADRLGWKEVVLAARDGATLAGATVPSSSASNALRAYPDGLLESPLDLREGRATLDPGTAAGQAPMLGAAPAAAPDRAGEAAEDGFAKLIGEDDLTLGVILVSIAIAMFWGAVHALSPGHGKAIVAAYLVGTRGTARQAFYLGAIVTVTHTIGVFALGLVTLALSELVVPDRLYPWLNLVAALLVVAVGLAVLRARVRGLARPRGARDGSGSGRHGPAHDIGVGGDDGHDHHGSHPHPHRHDGHHHDDHSGGHHDHSHHHHHHHHHHHPQPGMGWRGLLGVGVSGGILPCPSALVVLLAAISLHRVGYGLVLILAFSLGLAATITGIGLVAIGARRVFARSSFDGPIVRRLPAASALVILVFGIVMTVRAVPAVA